MAIKAGERLPAGILVEMTENGPAEISTEDLFAASKVVLFAVPGAFTPTCSAKHLPGFLQHADEIAREGVDTIACMAVNDVFVMDAWGKSQGVDGRIRMLADGNGDYSTALGLDVDSSAFNMGKRSGRFAIIVEDGVATFVAVDKPGQFEVSSAEAVIAQLRG
jgi:peroxiredoxin